MAAAKNARRPATWNASPRSRSSRCRRPRADALGSGRRAARRSWSTASSATARAPPARAAIPTSTTTTGCGAAPSRRSRPRSPTASASPQDRGHRTSQMPAFGADRILKPEQIPRRRNMCCRSPARTTTRRLPARASRFSRKTAPSATARPGAGKREFGAPRLTDAIWLYGKAPAEHRRADHTAASRRDAGLGARLDPVTIKELALYVHSLGGGEARSRRKIASEPSQTRGIRRSRISRASPYL